MGRFLSMIALLGVGLLGACTSAMHQADIATIKAGTSTYADVVKVFGLPDSEMNIAGGTKVALYHQGQYDRDPLQMIPFANLFATDYNPTPYDYFMFNREGVLQSFSIPHMSRKAGLEPPAS